MTKTKKELVGKMVEDKSKEMFKIKVETVAKEIQDILLANELGLQPFVQYTEHGVIPQVRLVSTAKPDGEEN